MTEEDEKNIRNEVMIIPKSLNAKVNYSKAKYIGRICDE